MGHCRAVDKIIEEQLVLGTPGEMYSEVIYELLNIT